MRYYNNFLLNVASPPKIKYQSDLQATVDKWWENSTQIQIQGEEPIKIQKEIGSLEYYPIDISVDMAIDIGTGMKKSDDYKIFSHRDLDFTTTLGTMYRWQNNYWLTTNVSDFASNVKSDVVRRCNNTLRWIDYDSREYLEEKVVIDYELTSPSPKVNKDIITPNGHRVLVFQYNERTRKIKKNQRFLFNGEAFKIVGINNALQNSEVDDSTTLVYYDAFSDVLRKDVDNEEFNIANFDEFQFYINIASPLSDNIMKGSTGQFKASVYSKDMLTTNKVKWSVGSSGATIDDQGNYEITGEVGEMVEFTASFFGIKRSIQLEIQSSNSDNTQLIIHPLEAEIYQGDSLTIETLLETGNQKTPIDLEFYSEGVPWSNYTISKNGVGKYKVTNLYPSGHKLIVKFKYKDRIYESKITLKALF